MATHSARQSNLSLTVDQDLDANLRSPRPYSCGVFSLFHRRLPGSFNSDRIIRWRHPEIASASNAIPIYTENTTFEHVIGLPKAYKYLHSFLERTILELEVIVMERVTTKQAGEILGISRRRVIALIEQKKLKAEKFGSVYSISRADLQAAVKRRNGRPPKEAEDESPAFRSFYDVARDFIGSIDADDLPRDLSSNKKYLEGLGSKEAEKEALKRRNPRR